MTPKIEFSRNSTDFFKNKLLWDCRTLEGKKTSNHIYIFFNYLHETWRVEIIGVIVN